MIIYVYIYVIIVRAMMELNKKINKTEHPGISCYFMAIPSFHASLRLTFWEDSSCVMLRNAAQALVAWPKAKVSCCKRSGTLY